MHAVKNNAEVLVKMIAMYFTMPLYCYEDLCCNGNTRFSCMILVYSSVNTKSYVGIMLKLEMWLLVA